MVSASEVAEAATSAVTAAAAATGEHPRGVLASRRRLFGPLLDLKRGSTPLVVTGLFQGCVFVAFVVWHCVLCCCPPCPFDCCGRSVDATALDRTTPSSIKKLCVPSLLTHRHPYTTPHRTA